jgi:4-alpha-glucanotransferase
MRKSGVLLHITSLPTPGGIGTLGADAYAFVDFLKKAGMSVWQVLPIGPTGYGESPYQSHGTHAGNINLIDLNFLVRDGLMKAEDAKRDRLHRL